MMEKHKIATQTSQLTSLPAKVMLKITGRSSLATADLICLSLSCKSIAHLLQGVKSTDSNLVEKVDSKFVLLDRLIQDFRPRTAAVCHSGMRLISTQPDHWLEQGRGVAKVRQPYMAIIKGCSIRNSQLTGTDSDSDLQQACIIQTTSTYTTKVKSKVLPQIQAKPPKLTSRFTADVHFYSKHTSWAEHHT